MAWKKGQSGNPRGRPRGKSAREALRLELLRPADDGRSRLDRWAEDLACETDVELRLQILRWLEGPAPPPAPPDDDDDKPPPRIKIPGAGGPERPARGRKARPGA